MFHLVCNFAAAHNEMQLFSSGLHLLDQCSAFYRDRKVCISHNFASSWLLDMKLLHGQGSEEFFACNLDKIGICLFESV